MNFRDACSMLGWLTLRCLHLPLVQIVSNSIWVATSKVKFNDRIPLYFHRFFIKFRFHWSRYIIAAIAYTRDSNEVLLLCLLHSSKYLLTVWVKSTDVMITLPRLKYNIPATSNAVDLLSISLISFIDICDISIQWQKQNIPEHYAVFPLRISGWLLTSIINMLS